MTEESVAGAVKPPATGKRFQPGYDARRTGRKPRRVEEAYTDALYEVLSLDKFKKLIEAQLNKALDGDPRAAKELLRQAIGNPKERIEISTAADGALAQIQAMMLAGGKELPHLIETAEPPTDADQWTVIDGEDATEEAAIDVDESPLNDAIIA